MDSSFSSYRKSFSTNVWHILSWILYAGGAGPIATVNMGVFVPLVVMKNAHSNGFLRRDHAIPCSSFPDEPCSVRVLHSIWIDVGSVLFAAFAFSTLIQLCLMTGVGVVCDYGTNRRYVLHLCVLIGSISSIILPWIPSSLFSLQLVSFVAIDLSFIIAQSCYDSFLPILLRYYPISSPYTLESAVEDETASIGNGSSSGDSIMDSENEEQYLNEQSLILNESAPSTDVEEEDKSRVAARLSSVGFSCFFGSAILFQLFLVPLMYKAAPDSSLILIAITVCGTWWLLLSYPICLFVKLPNDNYTADPIWKILFKSTKESYHSLQHAMSILPIRLFLFSRLFINCGLQTTLTSAIILGKSRLNLSNFQVALLGMGISLFALLGTIVLPYLTEYFRLTNLQTVIIIAMILPLAPLYGMLGFLPGFDGGVRTASDIFKTTIFVSFLLGGAHSFCRSVYSQLIPRGKETRFFALYALISQAGVFFGQISLTLISSLTTEPGAVYAFIMVVMILPLPFLWLMYKHTKSPRLA
ncbi:vacuolar amino acid efflux transporter Atg22 [Schizosaccharomyces cryophilus OY26]|uniref:Autophagy-related protein n=1 Tax=Schizosaccharomyces cryophilus (strain OY26 / ATCC MYA-4695 / CBS 11777 / NBRC 106824 / NRRL Y48691) TaxID=653667 RepID=S9XA66_SCHCR|nr:vacuolar amino acid efflux transporter Atg22 [Schizosaccharomyces cryophilus OY26]EPY54052.1 vacuolar amino acid efflux transporter Atg22 [Schizosaccharomyces cryophilus OY26]